MPLINLLDDSTTGLVGVILVSGAVDIAHCKLQIANDIHTH